MAGARMATARTVGSAAGWAIGLVLAVGLVVPAGSQGARVESQANASLVSALDGTAIWSSRLVDGTYVLRRNAGSSVRDVYRTPAQGVPYEADIGFDGRRKVITWAACREKLQFAFPPFGSGRACQMARLTMGGQLSLISVPKPRRVVVGFMPSLWKDRLAYFVGDGTHPGLRVVDLRRGSVRRLPLGIPGIGSALRVVPVGLDLNGTLLAATLQVRTSARRTRWVTLVMRLDRRNVKPRVAFSAGSGALSDVRLLSPTIRHGFVYAGFERTTPRLTAVLRRDLSSGSLMEARIPGRLYGAAPLDNSGDEFMLNLEREPTRLGFYETAPCWASGVTAEPGCAIERVRLTFRAPSSPLAYSTRGVWRVP